jgi:hypothetical protein
MMVEEWREIKDFEGIYEVSNFGNVRSLMSKKDGFRNLKLSANNTGYFMVRPHKGGLGKTCKVHRLVAETFIPNPYNKRTVNHIDGNKTNNHVSNLEWSTHSENTQHAYDIGLMEYRVPRPEAKIQGEKSKHSKLKESDIRYIRANSRKNGGNLTNRELAEKFGVGNTIISNIINFKKWKHVI